MGFRFPHLFIRSRISLRRVAFVLSLTVLAIYSFSMPSALYYFQYIPNEELLNDISIAARNGNPDKTAQLPFCPVIPTGLGEVPQMNSVISSANVRSSPGSEEILIGGSWKPRNCSSLHKVAIIVPYKNRETQLRIFIPYIHNFLKNQLLDYRIFVIEQTSALPFNRGALFNVGFTESLKLDDFHCFIFHDVDLLPLDTRNIYTCSKQPRHMSVSINVFRYTLMYEDIFGGVSALTREQFEAVNGFANVFFGWGGEDDDMSDRIHNKGMKITRWDPRISRYNMLRHAKEPANKDRYELMKRGVERYTTDGLNNLHYRIVRNETRTLYTWYLVDFH